MTNVSTDSIQVYPIIKSSLLFLCINVIFIFCLIIIILHGIELPPCSYIFYFFNIFHIDFNIIHIFFKNFISIQLFLGRPSGLRIYLIFFMINSLIFVMIQFLSFLLMLLRCCHNHVLHLQEDLPLLLRWGLERVLRSGCALGLLMPLKKSQEFVRGFDETLYFARTFREAQLYQGFC